jgi:Uma2 family endonuclease
MSIAVTLPQEQLWPPPGQWTYEDYLRLPDDGQRYEIIEGVLYVTNAPGFDHQFTVTELVGELRNFVKACKLGVVLTAPFEVHLSEKSRRCSRICCLLNKSGCPTLRPNFSAGGRI